MVDKKSIQYFKIFYLKRLFHKFLWFLFEMALFLSGLFLTLKYSPVLFDDFEPGDEKYVYLVFVPCIAVSILGFLYYLLQIPVIRMMSSIQKFHNMYWTETPQDLEKDFVSSQEFQWKDSLLVIGKNYIFFASPMQFHVLRTHDLQWAFTYSKTSYTSKFLRKKTVQWYGFMDIYQDFYEFQCTKKDEKAINEFLRQTLPHIFIAPLSAELSTMNQEEFLALQYNNYLDVNQEKAKRVQPKNIKKKNAIISIITTMFQCLCLPLFIYIISFTLPALHPFIVMTQSIKYFNYIKNGIAIISIVLALICQFSIILGKTHPRQGFLSQALELLKNLTYVSYGLYLFELPYTQYLPLFWAISGFVVILLGLIFPNIITDAPIDTDTTPKNNLYPTQTSTKSSETTDFSYTNQTNTESPETTDAPDAEEENTDIAITGSIKLLFFNGIMLLLTIINPCRNYPILPMLLTISIPYCIAVLGIKFRTLLADIGTFLLRIVLIPFLFGAVLFVNAYHYTEISSTNCVVIKKDTETTKEVFKNYMIQLDNKEKYEVDKETYLSIQPKAKVTLTECEGLFHLKWTDVSSEKEKVKKSDKTTKKSKSNKKSKKSKKRKSSKKTKD